MTSVPIRPVDLLLPRDYEVTRRRRVAAIIRHKETRRIPLGSCVTVVFESRESVLHQIHEVLRAEGPATDERVERTIAEYHPLLPGPRALTATVLVDGGSVDTGVGRALASCPGLIELRVGGETCRATGLDETAHDDCPVRYVRFDLSAAAVGRLANVEDAVVLTLSCQGAAAAVVLTVAQKRALHENLKTSAGDFVAHAASDRPQKTQCPMERI